MTTDMVRKQIYIRKRQEYLLKRMAQARNLSEAEIIRQAIDRQVTSESSPTAWAASGGIEDFTRLALEKRLTANDSSPYRWNRSEIYQERENRWLRDKEEE